MSARLFTYLACLGLASTASLALAQAPDANKHTARAYLGVALEQSANAEHPGVVVREVTPDSPAAHAGLKPGDEIVKVGDRQVREPDDLIAAVAQHKPGQTVTFQVMRGGQTMENTVKLGERPASRARNERSGSFLGVLSRPLTANEKERLGINAEHGAVVMEVLPNSPAAEAGLRRGDVITTTDGKPVTGPLELRRAVEQLGAGKEMSLSVQRGKETKEVRAKLEESPVDGIAMAPFAGRASASQYQDTDKVNDLERRVGELERRVHELEQKRSPEK